MISCIYLPNSHKIIFQARFFYSHIAVVWVHWVCRATFLHNLVLFVLHLSEQILFLALLNRKASASFSTFSMQWNSNEAAVMLETDNMKSPSIRIATMRKREFSIIRPTRIIRFLRCICTMNHWTAISSFAIQ